MGLFEELKATPETSEEDVVLQPREKTLDVPMPKPETPEEALLVARHTRAKIQEEEGMEFGTPVDLATQFNNTLIGAIGGSADMIAWAGRKAMTTLGASEETAYKFFASGGADFIKKSTGLGSDEAADTFMGYTGNTFGEAAAFLAGGASIVSKTKQATGVVGAISRQADVALKTKLGTVVAGEATVSVGAAAGRQISEENEFGAAGSMATEFATGALALVSAAGAKKVLLDPLTAKLKNMTAKEALEKLSKEEIAEVVAEGQRVIAKEAPATPKDTPAPTEFTIAIDYNPKYDGPNGIYSKVMGYKVRAKDGKDYYIETANSEQPSDAKFVVHAGSDMHGEWIGSYPTKKKAVEMLQSKKAEAPATPKDAPEPTPAPEGRTEDGNDFAPDVEDIIIRAGFNPDTFWRRPEYAQRAIDDMRNDVEIINNPQDKDSIAFEKAIKAIEKTQTPKAPATPKDTPEPPPAPKTPFKSTTGDASIDARLTKTEMMTPDEYLRQAWEATDGKLGGTYESWLASNKLTDADRAKYTQAMKDGDDFPLPYIDKYKGSQDGRNRALAAKEAGIKEIPVGIIEEPSVAVRLKDLQEELANTTSKMGRARIQEKIDNLTPKNDAEDAIDASIKAIDDILTGDRTGGEGARVTRRVKKHFRAVAREFQDDLLTLIKTGDTETAKKLLARIGKYKKFERKISEKDYAQGSELQANTRQAMDNGTTDYAAGITAAANKRTEDLTVLEGMIRKFIDDEAPIDTRVAKDVAEEAGKRADGAPKLSKEEKLDAIADQMAKTFLPERAGVFQQVIDGYFTVRLTQMLNQAKTAFVGVPSAIIMSVVRPVINTPYSIAKAAKLDVSLSRKAMYAASEAASTYEYVRMLSKHLKDTLRSAKDTVLNKGDSNFLYRDRNAYIKDQLAEASEVSHRVKRRMAQAQRREAARNAKTDLGRKVLTAKATVMNSRLANVPAFFFDYGVSLIGGLEEVSLIAHSLRAARAKGIKQAIDNGDANIWKSSEEYMEGAFDRSRGALQAKYDPEYADIFNQARRDHFRAMDLDPNDIRKDLIDGVVAGLNKISNNPDEMGFLARTLFVFIGVPMRALGANMSFIASPLNVAKNVAGGVARRAEVAMGGKATFGKYNKKISELELDIADQKKLLKSKDADVVSTAEKKLVELEDALAHNKDLKMQKDYEDLGKLGVGAGLFFLGYEMAKNGQVAGTDSWMTEEQKLAVQKVQGAPNSWKIVLGGNEFDFKYFEPLKGVFALGADYARRQAAEEAGSLTEDQTMTQFITSVSKSIATDSPFSTGIRYMAQIMSPNPDTQERGVLGVARSLVPVPAEVRNFNKFDEEFVTDTTSGEFADTVLSASLGQETGNYRLTLLGEPKLKEEPSLASYLLPFGAKKVPEREEIDSILLEDAMSFRSVSDIPTSISGFKLKSYINEENETLYSAYGRLITDTKIGGKTQRQALNNLVKTKAFKDAYKDGYNMNEQGAEVNEGIEMIKDIISEYRAAARKEILETKAATDYVDSDGNNIYDILKEREEFSERPESLLESLNLK